MSLSWMKAECSRSIACHACRLLQVLALIAVLKFLYILDHLTKPILLPGPGRRLRGADVSRHGNDGLCQVFPDALAVVPIAHH